MNRKLFINGQWVDALGGETLEIRDPANGEAVGTSALAMRADLDRAVAAAKAALPLWGAMHADERARILHRAADLIEERVDAIAMVLTREQGKPVPDSRKEILFSCEVYRYYAEEGRRIGGEIRPSSRSDIRSIVTSAPVGVVGGIVPWNYPVDLYAWKVAPVLAAGCTAVVKPPHETPLAIGMVVQCLADAGLPPGVLNDIPGTGPEVGAGLSAHPDVAMISATASVPAGQAIMRDSAATLKRLSLELGGHSPFVVLDDADVEEAAQAAFRRGFSNMGQICIAVNRIIVAGPVYDRFVEAITAITAATELGHGVNPGVLYGPCTTDKVRRNVQNQLEDALSRGARLLTGGSVPKGDAYERGFFYRPTLIDNIAEGSTVLRQETFGPLTAIQRAGSDAEALRLANATPFGLAAYVYSGDVGRGWRFAEGLEAGQIGVNVNDTTELQAPFGGWKMSGIGRELGPEGLMTFREKKHIKLRLGH
ncbi:MAG: aldehyde dehydrogenase family protein [Rhodobacteraceae bacterium]|jgi:succinate-semialdehyde dehydrogenase/glutarate-semialdehyde dehydrogenase|nr:aldehyde dehydrogenase family protein [Paracoccaceae bacterium]